MSLLKILPALGTIGRSRMEVLGIIPDAEAVIEILNSEVRKEATSRIELKSFRNAIRFENVSFAHSGDRPLLDKASFVIPKNSVTCIVGGSGAGKTTIINLILGLLSPTGGRILVDDRDLADYEISSIRRKAGFVSQDPFIFHSTIADNITFCSDEYSRDEIIEAARAANIHEFIASLEKGYDTMVGERGMKLSGGQQQRLTIARALIRKPDLLILDEATSAIDNKSEEEIRRSIADLTRRCTIIMVAHRLSTIKDADKILVLDKGVISEEGTHEELLERNGIYHDLYHSRETA
jgi:ABC-type multidrug transport system fused ATPase/permease subunit